MTKRRWQPDPALGPLQRARQEERQEVAQPPVEEAPAAGCEPRLTVGGAHTPTSVRPSRSDAPHGQMHACEMCVCTSGAQSVRTSVPVYTMRVCVAVGQG